MLLSSAAPRRAETSAVSKKLSRTASTLVQEALRGAPGAKGLTLAVFPFSSDADLAGRRLGSAVAELLLHHIRKIDGIRLVERPKLDAIMEEQKLHLSGAIATETAVEIGRLSGAEALVLGHVHKLGETYHVTARIVDVKTGEVKAASFEEFPSHLFETEAQPYLTASLIRPKLGVYLLVNYRHNPNGLPDQRTTEVNPNNFNIQQGYFQSRSFPLTFVGAGAKYYATRSFFVDLSAAFLVTQVTVAEGYSVVQGVGGTVPERVTLQQAKLFRGTFNYVHSFRHGLDGFAGAGVSGYSMKFAYAAQKGFATPTVRLGVDYTMQRRLGVGLSMNCDLLTSKARHNKTPPEHVAAYSRWSIEPALTVFF